jgi:hypothetical protein
MRDGALSRRGAALFQRGWFTTMRRRPGSMPRRLDPRRDGEAAG